MPAPPLRRWLIAAAVLAALVAVALWLKGAEGSRAKRASRAATDPAETAAPHEEPPTAPAGRQAPDPAAETEWRLEVEIRDERGTPIRGHVYVTDPKGALLAAEETEPPVPVAQTVRGTVDVITYAVDCVPQRFEGLTPPSTGVLVLVAGAEHGPGIEGRVFDDLGAPVTHRRAWRMMIRAYPLDAPPWLSDQSANWRRLWSMFSSRPREDGSFRIEGLPPRSYQIQCDPPYPEFDARAGDAEPLLQVEPVVARVGDTNVRIECVRAVEVRVRFTDIETGAELRTADSVASWDVMDGDRCLSSGLGSMRAGLTVTARPGTELTFTVKIEGYLPPAPLKLAVNREPGRQEAEIAFRRDVGGMAVLELVVRDELGQPVYPLMVGRPLAGMGRETNRDGRYMLRLPAGDQTVRLESPSDQRMLFTREWVPSNLDPDGYADARAYLPASFEVEVPRSGRVAREVRMQRAAFIWIRQEPHGAFRHVRVLRGETEIEGAQYDLYEDKGTAAAVEPGTYTVEGREGEEVVKVEVAAEAAKVAEVWLRATK